MDFGDQKNKILFTVRNQTQNAPEYIPHKKLITEAQSRPPICQHATPSSFSDWIFDLCHRPSKYKHKTDSLLMGRVGERRIQNFRLWYKRTRLPTPRINSHNEWRYHYIDPLDDSKSQAPFLASALTVNGNPLRCRPDIVLTNDIGEIMIIERKITRLRPSRPIPEGGWPNLKAQLWCYSWIDDFRRAPNVYLASQIWIHHDEQYRLSKSCPRWDKDDQKFQTECLELFTLLGGRFNGIIH